MTALGTSVQAKPQGRASVAQKKSNGPVAFPFPDWNVTVGL